MTLKNARLLVYEDVAALSRAAAEWLAELALEAVVKHGVFHWVLSGGGTPGLLYTLLAKQPYQSSFPWAKTHVYWGDERCVPPDHHESNYGQARRLLLDHVPLLPENVHRMKGEMEPNEAAADYIAQLRQWGTGSKPWPRFDVVLLGMGDDGHTASLFPGPISMEEQQSPATTVTAHYDGRPAHRVTLTPMALNSARQMIFLVAGASKAATLQAIWEGSRDPERWPVHRLHPEEGAVTWMVDEAAAARLNRSHDNSR